MKGFDIKRFREEKNLTQKQLADILDCNQAFISAIQHGKRDIPDEKYYLLVEKFGDLSDYITTYADADFEEIENQATDKIGETAAYIPSNMSIPNGYISLPSQFLDELTKLTDTIHSQQRTIEKLVNQKIIN